MELVQSTNNINILQQNSSEQALLVQNSLQSFRINEISHSNSKATLIENGSVGEEDALNKQNFNFVSIEQQHSLQRMQQANNHSILPQSISGADNMTSV
jgi:hypothetical protein